MARRTRGTKRQGLAPPVLQDCLQRLYKSEEVIPLEEECLFYDLWELNIVRAEGRIIFNCRKLDR